MFPGDPQRGRREPRRRALRRRGSGSYRWDGVLAPDEPGFLLLLPEAIMVVTKPMIALMSPITAAQFPIVES